MSSGNIVFRGTIWILTGSFGKHLSAFSINIFLARMLTQESFNLAVILLTILALMQIFSEMGITVALVQKEELTINSRDNAFYLSYLIVLLYFYSYIIVLLVYKINMNIKSDIYLLTVDRQKCVQGETRIKITHIIMKYISHKFNKNTYTKMIQ